MKNSRKLLIAIAALGLASLACSFGAANTGEVNIAEAYMSSDSEGDNRTTVYSSDQDFHAAVDIDNAFDSSEVRIVWLGAEFPGDEPNIVIYEYSTTTTGSGILVLHLSNEEPGFLWPIGQYRADIYLNGELDTSLTFEVQ